MFGMYERLNVPVWAHDMQVIRALYRKFDLDKRFDPAWKENRRHFTKMMLEYHHRQQEMCATMRI